MYGCNSDMKRVIRSGGGYGPVLNELLGQPFNSICDWQRWNPRHCR